MSVFLFCDYSLTILLLFTLSSLLFCLALVRLPVSILVRLWGHWAWCGAWTSKLRLWRCFGTLANTHLCIFTKTSTSRQKYFLLRCQLNWWCSSGCQNSTSIYLFRSCRWQKSHLWYKVYTVISRWKVRPLTLLFI